MTHKAPSLRDTLIGGLWTLTALLTIALVALSIAPQIELLGKVTAVEQIGSEFFVAPQEVFTAAELPVDIAYMAATLATNLVCLLLSILIFVRQRHQPAALFTSFFLVIYGVLMAGTLETLVSHYRPDLSDLVFQTEGFFWIVFGVTLLLIFPDGRFVPRWTRWLPPVLVVWILPTLIIPALNPATLKPDQKAAFWTYIVLFILPSAFAIYAQVHRYRQHANSVQRLQLRWAASGFVGLFVAGTIFPAGLIGLTDALASGDSLSGPIWGLMIAASRLMWPIGVMLPPITIGIAVLRYRLYDIDLIVRRTLVYALVTALLALAYFGDVVILQGIFSRFMGGDSPLVIVASTLLIAALFNPVRRRVQDFIDRRFYRSKYNTAHTLEQFGDVTRDAVDMARLEASLLDVVNQTMQPEHVSLWLHDRGGRNL